MASVVEIPQFVDPELARTQYPLDVLRPAEQGGSNFLAGAGFSAHTSGQFTSADTLTGAFSDLTSVHDIRIDAGATAPPDGYTCNYKLSGWRRIDYVAIGFLQNGIFHHIKRRHVEQDSILTSTVFASSLLLRAQRTEWALTASPFQFRMYIKGEADQGAACEIQSLSIFHAEPEETPEIKFGPEFQGSLASVRRFRDRAESVAQLEADADHYATTGEIAILPGKRFTWPPSAEAPVGPMDNATLRFSWHALHPAARLATSQGVHAPTLRRAAAEIAVGWIQGNIHHQSGDQRYAWYDHGAAERLVSLLIILNAASLDAPRSIRNERIVMSQIVEHARLLASAEFYAANQVTVYHNHAWFQDIALLVAGTAFRGTEAIRWREIALDRIAKQFDKLIIIDDDFAIFSENSIAYHQGITATVELVAELDAGSLAKTAASELVEPLKRWGAFLAYDHGPAPTHGDSYRASSRVGSRRTSRHDPGVKLLPTAGYAVVHGKHEFDRYSLFLFNTSANPTHKHHDNASITLGFAGVEWLVDPSFYSHDYASDIPRYLRGRWAHNALNISNAEYNLDPGLTTLTGVAQDCFEFTASHRAYAGLEVSRTLRGNLAGLDLELEDWFEGDLDDASEPVVCFHLGEGVTIHPTDQPERVRLRHPSTERTVELILPSPQWQVVRGRGASDQLTSVIGHGFQESVDSETIQVAVSRRPGVRHASRIRATS